MLAEKKRIADAQEKPLVYLAEFAPLSFTRLLVGDMSIEEMLRYDGECDVVSGGENAQWILDILFPKQLYHFDLFWW
jgi:hypothetical protein